MTAKPSQDPRKEAAKLKRVQGQDSSIIDVKKSFRYLLEEEEEVEEKEEDDEEGVGVEED